MEKKGRSRKKLLIWLISILISIPLVLFPVTTVVVYEIIFWNRYETVQWAQFSVDEFPGLAVERSDFESDGVLLAGYKYTKTGTDPKGVIILSHGLGGGHNTYMPIIDQITSGGYYVFAYDARGNDNSGGEDVEGLPQSLIDLDSAIEYVSRLTEYQGLPVGLFGHSWGGYAVGNVLNLHPEVKAAVIVAGFNRSEDMIAYHGEDKAGKASLVMMPYLRLYERLKFGSSFADTSAVEGMGVTEAGILVVHSRDDETVPTRYGYDAVYAMYGESDRFSFILYEDKGHEYPLFSDEAMTYRENLNAQYLVYIESTGQKNTDAVMAAYMEKNLDKMQCFEPNPQLMDQTLALYDFYCSTQ